MRSLILASTLLLSIAITTATHRYDHRYGYSPPKPPRCVEYKHACLGVSDYVCSDGTTIRIPMPGGGICGPRQEPPKR